MNISEAIHNIGLSVFREPWKFNIEPDFTNETGSQFYIYDDLTDYLKRDSTDGKIIFKLKDAVIMRAYNPKTNDTDILYVNGEDVLMCETDNYEGVCYWIDAIRTSQRN